MVAGDVTPDEVRRLAETTYSRVAPQGARPERLRAREPEPKALRRVAVADPKVEQPTLQRLYLTPSCITARDGGCHDLELLAEVLGGGSTSYLYRKLVMETGLAVNAGAWYMGSAIDDTRFSVYAVPAEGVPLEKLEEAVDKVLRRAPAQALYAEAIERAKTRLVAETVYSSDSQSSLARIYGSALAIGETIEEVRRWPTDIEAVTQDRLKTAAERVRSGESVLLFPEGGRSYRHGLDPFMRGSFVLAIEAGVPVVPVLLVGHTGAVDERIQAARPGEIACVFCEAVPTDGLHRRDAGDLCDRVRAVMERELERFG